MPLSKRRLPTDKEIERCANVCYQRYVDSGHKDLEMEDLAADLNFYAECYRAAIKAIDE